MLARRAHHAVLSRPTSRSWRRARATRTSTSADLSAIRVSSTSPRPRCWRSSRRAIPHAVQLTIYGGTEGGVRRSPRARRSARGPPEHLRRLPAGDRAARRRRDDGQPLGPGERGIIQFRGYNTLERLLQGAREDRRVDARRRLGDDERPRRARRARPRAVPRAREGDAQGRRRERRAAGDRVAALHPPGGQARRRSSASPTSGCSRCRPRSSSCCPGREATEEELIEHCRGAIASFKVPRHDPLHRGDEWPMSATKIQRFELRDRLLEELGTRT